MSAIQAEIIEKQKCMMHEEEKSINRPRNDTNDRISRQGHRNIYH